MGKVLMDLVVLTHQLKATMVELVPVEALDMVVFRSIPALL